MLTSEQNDLLTQTGPGTPGGDLLRRYWQPVALSEELPSDQARPVPVRIMGEDLVLFRDDRGRPGLLGLHCSHRGADLSYARCEGGGLRCLYHGWLYDAAGNCLEQPGEPVGSDFHNKVRHPAYPCNERGGLIFTYMGPGGPPLPTAYEFLLAPEEHRWSNKVHHDCSYLQANEGNIDPVHLSFLHRLYGRTDQVVRGGSEPYQNLLGRYQSPLIDVEETDFGLRIATVRNPGGDDQYLRVSYFVLPNLSAFPGSTGGDGYSVNWHVPIDDTHHWKYQIAFKRSGPLDKERFQRDYEGEMLPGYRLRRNRENRYLQDREEMRSQSFIGMGTLFAGHDKFVTEGEGPIQDRTTEHLGYTDKAIAASRRALLNGIAATQAGREPPHVVRDPAANCFDHLQVLSEMVPAGVDWREHLQRALAGPELATR